MGNDSSKQEANNETSPSPQELWIQFGGNELEPPLRSGAVALLDSNWLVRYWGASDKEKSLPRRQDLPPEAFLSCDQIIEATTEKGQIPIIALSYMWLQPDFPDPKGTTLKLVGEATVQMFHGIARQPWGIFWDFCSLFQHPDPQNGLFRTSQEERLFREGLEALPLLFAHTHTHCFKLTKLPKDYPKGFNLPEGANVEEYNQRGWPLVESCWMNMTKPSGNTTEIAARGNDNNKYRPAPLMPKRFEERLNKATFTNAKEDRPLVLRLYQGQFEKRFANLRELACRGLGWDDQEITHLVEILDAGYMPHLVHIDLSLNPDIGATGYRLLAPHLVLIRSVNLDACGISRLRHTNACQSLAEAAEKKRHDGNLVELRDLSLQGNHVNDKDVEALSKLICRDLERVNLEDCAIGDSGCKELAEAAILQCTANSNTSKLPSAQTPRLQTLCLEANDHITKQAIPHLCKLVKHCPHLTSLKLGKRLDGIKTRVQLRSNAANRDLKIHFGWGIY